MIQFNQLSFSRDNKQLLDCADLTIHASQKVGLIGTNGSGKTSLLMLLKGELSADDGLCSIPKHLKMAHLEQEIPQTEQSALSYVVEGDHCYHTLQQQLEQAEHDQDGMKIAELHMGMAEIEGYAVPSKAAKILHGLGFSNPELEKAVKAFSGGWQMRLNLARLLMSRADILALDEPTNHLDMEAVVWLENWLKDSSQTILLISHDRDFIDNVATHIVHLHQRKLKLYTGNYSAFEKQRAEQLAVQQATYQKQQASRAHLQSYVDRFRYKASKARQAQSRIKMLERMDQVSAVQNENPFRFVFKEAPAASNPMLTLDHIGLGYGDKQILKNINYAIRQGERIGLIGQNGAGKSTFIKYLAGEIPALSGELHASNKIKVGYFAQHQLDLLHPEDSPLHHLLQIARGLPESKARAYLGGFAFSNDEVFRPIKSFSGGEKARLVLALIIWQAPNLLLLDEPTNHLDLEMREALNLALQNYSGALIMVSHDRHLLNCVTNELWLVAHGKVDRFDGDLDDYQRWVIEQNRLAERAEEIPQEKPKAKAKNPPQSKIDKLEKQLRKLEAQLTELDQSLSRDDIYQTENKTQLAELVASHDATKKAIQEIEAELLELYSN